MARGVGVVGETIEMDSFGILLMLRDSFVAFDTFEMFTCSGLMLRQGPP